MSESAPTASSKAEPLQTPPQSLKPEIIDDKSPHCIPFILSRLEIHLKKQLNKPFFIGLNGVQGAGKTTLVSALASALQMQDLETVVCSIDDLYLTHKDQQSLAAVNPSNPLLQHRGEPGTHDMQLAQLVFTALEEGAEVQIPKYDKSAHNGAGDRLPTSLWPTFNAPTQRKVQVVILEGWCVGFRNLPEASLAAKYTSHSVTLHKHRLEDLKFINDRLKQYDIVTDLFDAFIHIDAEDLMYVYEWRLEQEHALWKEKGTGMSDELVKEFVDGYFPAYELYTDELYTDELRNGWPPKKVDWAYLRLVIGKDRKVKNAITRVKGT